MSECKYVHYLCNFLRLMREDVNLDGNQKLHILKERSNMRLDLVKIQRSLHLHLAYNSPSIVWLKSILKIELNISD